MSDTKSLETDNNIMPVSEGSQEIPAEDNITPSAPEILQETPAEDGAVPEVFPEASGDDVAAAVMEDIPEVAADDAAEMAEPEISLGASAEDDTVDATVVLRKAPAQGDTEDATVVLQKAPEENEVSVSEVKAAKKADKKAKKERRRKKWFWARLVAFICIALIVLTYFIYVLTPKYQYGICSIFNYYGVDKGTVDVLAVGTSLSYTDLNTNILWDEYGIACYDLGTAEQPFWSTYYYLKEALKYQTPKVVLLDLKAITYLEDKVDRTRTVLCSYGLLNPVSRLQCIYECIEPEEFMGYALAYSQIHTNYLKTRWSDFVTPPNNGGRGPTWKGYLEKDETADHDEPAINFSFATPTNGVNEHEAEYFEKILQLCQEKNVTVMLVGYPNADYKHDHLYYCWAFQLAEKYGVTGINYNLPQNRPAINYHTDCADWQHLNVHGSVVFTRAVGEDLKELFDLEDHRGDPAYASYDECAELWFKKYPQYRQGAA